MDGQQICVFLERGLIVARGCLPLCRVPVGECLPTLEKDMVSAMKVSSRPAYASERESLLAGLHLEPQKASAMAGAHMMP